MTLVFLGAVPRARIAALSALAAQCAARLSLPFAFRLEQSVFRARQRMVWALPQSVPSPLVQLVADLENTLRDESFTIEDRAWRAHVTLVRDAVQRADLQPPALQWTAGDFALVESVRGEYRVLARWPDGGGA